MIKNIMKKRIKIAKAIAMVIRELGQVPAGHLYATLMGQMSLDEFNSYIDLLIDAGLVKRDASHLLHFIEPTK